MIRSFPFFPSRLWPKAASGQRRPSRQLEETSWRMGAPPSFRYRLARLRPVQGWRTRSQPGMSSILLPVTGPSPSAVPRLVEAVSGDRARAVAGFGAGPGIRAAAAATARSRMRPAPRPRTRTGPGDRSVPGTAATCPCGRERRTEMAASAEGSAIPPASAARTASTRTGGIPERSATVRLRMRFPSRHASRGRMAGGEDRFGMTSTPGAMGPILAWQHKASSNLSGGAGKSSRFNGLLGIGRRLKD